MADKRKTGLRREGTSISGSVGANVGRVRWRAPAIYVALVLGSTTFLVLSGLRADSEVLIAVAQLTPALATLALLVAARGHGVHLGQLGLRQLGDARWYALAFLVPILTIGLSYAGTDALGLVEFRWPLDEARVWALMAFRVTVAYLTMSLPALVWAFLEEVGWRGWLQGSLLPVLGARGAVLLTGVVWAVWHYPFILWAGYYEAGSTVVNALLFTAAVVPMGVLFGWVRLSSGSLWPVVALHAAVNGARTIWDANFAPSDPSWVYFAGEAGMLSAALWLVLAWVAWRRLSSPGMREQRPTPRGTS